MTRFQTEEQHATSGEDGRRLLNADEVAGMLGVSKEWVWQESREDESRLALGRFRRYRKEAIERWLSTWRPDTIATYTKTAGRRVNAPARHRRYKLRCGST